MSKPLHLLASIGADSSEAALVIGGGNIRVDVLHAAGFPAVGRVFQRAQLLTRRRLHLYPLQPANQLNVTILLLENAAWNQSDRNEEVRRITKQPNVTAIIRSRRLSIFGHTACMQMPR